VGIPDPQRHGEMLGYRVEIVPAEAETIRAIYEWYADGASIPSIITRLTTEAISGPRGGRWRLGTIRRLLRNPKYRGLLVWGRTQQTRKPGSRAIVTKRLPSSEWHTLKKSELRIVADELAVRVETRWRSAEVAMAPHRRGRPDSLLGGTPSCTRERCSRASYPVAYAATQSPLSAATW
jgi:hypothetical protein